MSNYKKLPPAIVEAVNAILGTCGTSLRNLTQVERKAEVGKMLRVKEACARLGISQPTFYRMVKSGRIKPVYIGERCTRIPESQIAALGAERVVKHG